MRNDEHWMRHALAWSARGRGWTSPRPSVGCVLVKDEQILGGGHTQPGDGNPHGEIAALRAAREAGHDQNLRGATAYVTLEPCSHYATTPPCTRALIEAGIQRVVCGVRDPNPAVNGRGYAQLRAAGIEVVEDFMLRECFRAQDDFLFHITQRAPFVTLKVAASLDGSIATASGESQWITGPAARERAHVLRHEHDAVLVGIGTLLADDPQLSVRLSGRWKQPARLVIDPRAETPTTARIFEPGPDGMAPRVYLAVAENASPQSVARLEERGAHVWRFLGARIEWSSLLAKIYEVCLYSVLVEGGARVASQVLQAGVAHKVAWFSAPLLIPGGLRALGETPRAPGGAAHDEAGSAQHSSGFALERLAQAPRLHDIDVERVDDDVLTTGYLQTLDVMTPAAVSLEEHSVSALSGS